VPFIAHAAELSGKVVRVLDGDTIDVLTAANGIIRVRLMGIDCPEKGQAFGQVAKRQMSDLAGARAVAVTWFKKDRNGRLIGKVVIGRADVGLEMVRKGLAWHFKRYESEQNIEDRALYARAEAEARVAKRGLWSDKEPEAPWDYRKQRRTVHQPREAP
jgi:endonuclease YncB( thermonuclease family)